MVVMGVWCCVWLGGGVVCVVANPPVGSGRPAGVSRTQPSPCPSIHPSPTNDRIAPQLFVLPGLLDIRPMIFVSPDHIDVHILIHCEYNDNYVQHVCQTDTYWLSIIKAYGRSSQIKIEIQCMVEI